MKFLRNLAIMTFCFIQIQSFERVVIWGHPLHSHTHSYIHYAFHKAFKHLGYEVHWLDEHSDISDLDLSDALFITEGQACKGMPIRDDAFYILHNVMDHPLHKMDRNKFMTLQVYTDDVLGRVATTVEEERGCWLDRDQNLAYICWATDLLPHEIEAVKRELLRFEKKREVVFIGTLGFDNPADSGAKILEFYEMAKEYGFSLNVINPWSKPVSFEENKELVMKAVFAPAMQGDWQVEHGYIPCRIFKNISYGGMGITNSERVWELFDRKIVYDPDPKELFRKAYDKWQNYSLVEQFELMDYVKENHTYINRIEFLLRFIDEIQAK